MRKDEFLKLLRQALAGDVPVGVIEENIRYYDSYITDEVRKGMAEEDVIAEIGDPRLIAKTIEETTDGAGDGAYSDVYEDRSQGRSGQSEYGQGSYERNPYKQTGGFHVYNLNKWYWKLLAVVIVFSVLFIVVSIIGGIFSLLIPLLSPLLMIWLIFWIIRSFTRR